MGGNLMGCPCMLFERPVLPRKTGMFRLSAVCFAAALMAGAFMPTDAAAQYSGGGRSGGYFGGGGGYHAEEAPRRERRERQSGSGQCYKKRTKVQDNSGRERWESQTVCE